MRRWVFVLGLVLALGACASADELSPTLPAPADTEAPTATLEPIVELHTPTAVLPPTATLEPIVELPTPTAAPPPTAQPGATAQVVAGQTGLPLPNERRELFSAAGACTVCHTGMVDGAGNAVSLDEFWRATMMANSARDPYWRASVRGEVISNPGYQASVEDKCATCHMPMARFTLATGEQQAQIFGGLDDPAHGLHTLAIDGVSCTLCHQIEAEGLGQHASFGGGFVINSDLPQGQRLNYGPFPAPKGQANLMQSSSGFIPVESQHVQQRDFCSACHTLYTPYLNAQGEIVGEFPEQMPYLEWVYSDYRKEEQVCQDCHMPPAQGAVTLSVTGSPPRSPLAQHVFVGGNVFMYRVLQQFGAEMAVTASGQQFEANVGRILDQVQNRTATLALENVQVSGSSLLAEVVVQSQVGHKFPTGFPARRAWLRLSVRDASGALVFESGAVGQDGLISGNDNDDDPAAYEAHYELISSPEQVQIYEAIMGNTEGQVTTTLLRAASYLKDNRLLPRGFDKSVLQEDIAVRGAALGDADFVGGGDRVRYQVALGAAPGPFTVEAQLLYQAIGYRWANNLRRYDAPEADNFIRYYESVPNLPVTVASATIEVE